jgi:CubicO group peptidase (beta-lactamase class C family)
MDQVGASTGKAYRLARGQVAPGFEEVRAEFERNLAERGEIGAAVSAYWRGEKVVDLWGGRRSPEGNEPWEEDTTVVVCSTTKGVSAMTLAVANARGWLHYDAPIARYWPEFAQNGKGTKRSPARSISISSSGCPPRSRIAGSRPCCSSRGVGLFVPFPRRRRPCSSGSSGRGRCCASR